MQIQENLVDMRLLNLNMNVICTVSSLYKIVFFPFFSPLFFSFLGPNSTLFFIYCQKFVERVEKDLAL